MPRRTAIVLVIVALLIALAAGGGIGYYVGHANAASPDKFATVSSINVQFVYAPGTPAFLSVGPSGGCTYIVCPFELSWNATGLLGGVGDIGFILLSTAASDNLSANVTAVSSVPSGVGLLLGFPVLVLANQTLAWGAATVTFPETVTSYVLTITVSAR